MLRGIPDIIGSDLLKALADTGHGDLIVIADHFYSGAAFAHQLKNSGFGTVENPSEVGDEFVRSIKARLGIESTTTAQALIRQAYDHGQISYTNSKEFSNYIG